MDDTTSSPPWDLRPQPTTPAAIETASAVHTEPAAAKRAKAGLLTIIVAISVAVLTLAAAAATLLITGIVPLSGLEGRIAAAIADRLGPGWTVEARSAELGRIDGHSQLRVRQVSFQHQSGAVIRAPEAILGYEPLALLRGEIRLVSVDLRGVNVRLGVDRNGALVVNADATAAETQPPVTLPDAAQWNLFTGLMGAVTTLSQSGGILGSLETAGMHGARLSLVDPEGRQKAGFEDVDFSLARMKDGVTRLTAKGRTGPRWKEFQIDLTREPDGTQRVDLEIVRFEPAEVVTLALGSGAVEIDKLPLRGHATLTQKPDGQRIMTGRFEIEPGTIRFPDSPLSPLAIDGGHVELATEGDFSTLAITSGALNAGQLQMRGKGTLREDGGAWRIELDGTGQIAGLEGDPAIAVDALKAKVVLDPRTNDLKIDQIAMDGPAIHAELVGQIRKQGESPTQKLAVKATDSDVRAVLAIWPRWSSPDVHGAMSKQFAAGRIGLVDVKLDLPAEDHARLVKGAGMPDGALSVQVQASGVRYIPGPGLPPLVDGVITGSGTGRTVQLTIEKATADLGGDRRIALSEGSVSIPETWVERAPARITFRSNGPVESLAALFTFPALKDFGFGGIDPAALRGVSDLRSVVNLPLVDDPKPSEVVVQTSGLLSNISSDTLLGTEKLEGANLAVAFDRTGLTAKGDGRVGGDRAQIELRQDKAGRGEASVSLALDNAARQKRGFGPEFGLSGPIQLKASRTLGKPDAAPRIEVDLSKASFDGVIPGVSKAAGKPGKVSFNLVSDADGPDLEDFTFDMAPALIKGRIELTKQNGLDVASLSTVRLSPGDNLKIEARRDGSLTKLTIRGSVMDVRPFIRDMQTASTPAQRGDKGKTGDLDIDLDVPILTGFNSEAISNASFKLSRRNGDIRSMAFQGRIGRADVSARQAKANDNVVVQSENGGSLLRFVDLYRRAYGGDLVLNLAPGDARQSGEFLFRNFVVRDEPALRRVIGEQPPAMPSSDRQSGQGATPRIDTTEVGFTKLRAEFTRSASRLDVSDMVIWGQQVGFTLQGNVDYGRDRVDIGGTFVPGYAFNNAFAQVPVVGAILGGGSQYGGLFAVNFKISGAASAPTMTVNPLSALAPGILRRFVDPLGGAPDRQPIQPSPQPQAPPTR